MCYVYAPKYDLIYSRYIIFNFIEIRINTILFTDFRVLYISIHRYEHGWFWPNLRESDYDYIGEKKGLGYNVNIPLNKVTIEYIQSNNIDACLLLWILCLLVTMDTLFTGYYGYFVYWLLWILCLLLWILCLLLWILCLLLWILCLLVAMDTLFTCCYGYLVYLLLWILCLLVTMDTFFICYHGYSLVATSHRLV